jgi:hypothetical protein
MSTQWIVNARCVIIKSITCEGCTEAQAHDDPFAYAIDELEIDQEDWDVISVKREDT